MFPATAKDSGPNNDKNSACEIKDDLHNIANQAGRKVRSLLNTAGDDISHASGYVAAEIRSNPVRSATIALGIGVLLGALLRR